MLLIGSAQTNKNCATGVILHTLHIARYTLHVTHCTLHIAHYTLHVTHYTLRVNIIDIMAAPADRSPIPD